MLRELCLTLSLIVAIGCTDRIGGLEPTEDGGVVLPTDSGPRTSLSIFGLSPARGGFYEPTTVLVRGDGLAEDGVWTVGGSSVVATWIDSRRVQLQVPPSSPGTVEIAVVQGEDRARAVFTYDALAVSPNRGPRRGGVPISLRTYDDRFREGEEVRFGDSVCPELRILDARRASCTLPEHPAGSVDVVLRRDGADVLVAGDAFRYEDLDDGFGGVGGGPIDGELRVTVLGTGGAPLPGAYVQVGRDPVGALHGTTDANGVIVFTDPELRGPLAFHVSHPCYERVSYVGVDAREAVLPLARSAAAPRDACPTSPMPPAPSTEPARIGGELVFLEGQEFPTPIFRWVGVPSPRANERRVAYVGTTAGVLAPVEIDETTRGTSGYPFELEVRPEGTVAVYAVAGVLDTTSNTFAPYQMGIARLVPARTGETTRGVEVLMDIPLDQRTVVEIEPPAGSSSAGRTEVSVGFDLLVETRLFSRASLQLPMGARGELPPRLDFVTSNGEPATFLHQPQAYGTLRNAPRVASARWLEPRGIYESHSYAYQALTGPSPHSVTALPGIPTIDAPEQLLTTGGTIRWTVEDGLEAQRLEIVSDTGQDRAWILICAPSVREVELPSGPAEHFGLRSSERTILALRVMEWGGARFDELQVITLYAGARRESMVPHVVRVP